MNKQVKISAMLLAPAPAGTGARRSSGRPPASAASQEIADCAGSTVHVQPDGTHRAHHARRRQQLLAWGYGDRARQMQYPGPTLIVNQGDTVTVTLTNTLRVPVSIVFPGQAGVTATGGVAGLLTETRLAAGGGTVTYTFTASQPGTYLYQSGTQPELADRDGPGRRADRAADGFRRRRDVRPPSLRSPRAAPTTANTCSSMTEMDRCCTRPKR